MLRRKIYDKILNWKNRSQGRSALLIEGARRVGKSKIVEFFAQHEYRTFTADVLKCTFTADVSKYTKIRFALQAG